MTVLRGYSVRILRRHRGDACARRPLRSDLAVLSLQLQSLRLPGHD